MIKIGQILCPIDFSDYSRHAADHALAVARWYDSTVTFLHVLAATPVAAYAAPAEIIEPVLTPADLERVLAEMRRFIEPAPAVPVEMLVGEGNASVQILRQAEALHADLLVMGTHGRSGFERFFLGSVVEKVLRKARCPVLSVPPRVADAAPGTPVLFKRILCPVDFSHSSIKALNYAMSLAQESDARLTLLHVMEYDLKETPDMYDTTITDRTLSLADFRKGQEEISRQRLADLVPEAVRAYCTVDTMLGAGKPYREILRMAAEQQSDLIVIGIQGRGEVDLMFFGSTTQQVIRQAACPVLTLRRD